MTTVAAVSTYTERLEARAKLPDDLAYDEFAHLVDDIQRVISFAAFVHDDEAEGWDVSQRVDSRLEKVQYGSDFLVVMAFVTPLLAGGLTFATIWEKFSKSRLQRAERRLKEQELRERIEAAEAGPLAERRLESFADLMESVLQTLDEYDDPSWEARRNKIIQVATVLSYSISADRLNPPTPEVQLLDSLARLADFAVDLRTEVQV